VGLFPTKKIILLKAGGAARLGLPAFVIPYSHEKRLNRIHKSKTYSTMKSKLLNCIVAFSFIALAGNAQTPADALRLSIAQPYGGTARTMGVSGAMGALGADYSAIGINPAGLASFRTSEFVITPGYTSVSTDAVLYNKEKPNNVVNDGNAKFYLSNCAFVRAHRPEGGNWTTQNWSIGFSRLKTFDASFYFKGESQGSIVNRMQEKANTKQTKLNEFEEQLAVETGAIYTKKNDPTYFASDFDGYALELITKSQQGLSSGRISQLDFSYAANYKEKIQIGASIGVPFMSFYDNKIYQETDVETAKDYGNIPSFKALSFTENYGATGTGINAKLGIIVKPFQALRIGAALQTPNSYKVSESYDNAFSYTYWEDGPKGASEVNYEAASPDGTYDYIIRTPWRFTGSAALLAGKKGFLSLDVDYIDYSTMAFQYQLEDKDAEIDINNEIKKTYIATTNFRLGGEFTKDIFRFRVGMGMVGLPVRVDSPDYFRDATKTYSLGVGLREKKFYFDVAYQFARSSDNYSPYRVSIDYEQPEVARTQNNSQFIATLGFKF
jgi:hypothetical protein